MAESTNYRLKVTGYPENAPGYVHIDLNIEEVEINGRYHLVVNPSDFVECLKHEAHLVPDEYIPQ